MKRTVITFIVAILLLACLSVSLFACVEKTYTITFDTDGGSEIGSITISKENDFTLPDPPVKVGYTFAGWYLDKDTWQNQLAEDSDVSNNISVYAKWTINTYTITFDSNGGSETGAVAVDAFSAIVLPTKPSKEGYVFGGWFFDDETFSDPLTENSVIDNHILNDITVYAQWLERTPENIENSDIIADDFIRDDDNLSLVLPNQIDKFSFFDKIFVSIASTWELSTDIQGNDIISSQTVALDVGNNPFYIIIKSENEVTAVYFVNLRRNPIYNIHFYIDGEFSDTLAIEEGSTVNAPETQSLEGYTFNGWYDHPECEGDLAVFPYLCTENMNFFASWIANNYEIPLDNQGGAGASELQGVFNQEMPEVAAPTKAGYYFNGYFSGENGTGSQYYSAMMISMCNWTLPYSITLYAFWTTGTGGLQYALKADETYEIVGYYGDSKDVCIPGTYQEKQITEIADYAFSGNDNIVSIYIPGGISRIGDFAFYHCGGLLDIYIDNGVASIGNSAFHLCTGLKGLVIPNSVINIGIDILKDCTTLESLTAPFCAPYDIHNNSYLRYYFGGTSYNTGTIPASLKTVTASSTTLRIADNAFYNAGSLMNIYIPESVTDIGNYAFSGCDSLSCLTIPQYVNHIGNGAFYHCAGLQNITVSQGNACYQSIAGVLFDISGARLLQYPINNDSLSYTMPENVTEISDYAFSYCQNLTDLVISDRVISIGDYALYGCGSIARIILPDSLIDIGDYAFSYCQALSNLIIPDSVTTIGYRAFYNNSGLGTIKFSNFLSTLGTNALEGCTALVSLTAPFKETYHENDNSYLRYYFGGTSYSSGVAIPSSLKSVIVSPSCTVLPGYAFYNATGLTSIDLPQGLTNIGACSFYNCYGLLSIRIPALVASIGASAFYGCATLTTIVIPDEVVSIGSSAFSGCTKLTSMVIGGKVASVGSSAFYGCSGLTDIDIPSSVTSIDSDAFSGCSGLKGVYITNLSAWCAIELVSGTSNPLYYAKNLYLDKVQITSLTIPDGVAGIGSYAFYNCTALTSVTIPSSVTGVGNYAFANCTSLPSVTIGDSVTSVGSYAFNNCTALASVTLPSSVTSIGSSAFYGCSGMKSITLPFVGASLNGTSYTHFGYIFGAGSYDYNSSYVPSSLQTVIIMGGNSIGSYAFYNCTSVTSITIPDSVTSVGSYAFNNCNGLTAIYITDLAVWCGISFGTANANPLYYAYHLYLNDVLVTEIAIPDGVSSVGSYAFYNCSGLTSITIPNNVTSIGSSAFRGCSGLTSITLPFVGDSLNGTSYTHFGYIFGAGSYDYNSNYVPSSLRTVIITGGNSIGSYAFYNCTSLTSITIPDSVTSIGNSAYTGCSGLTSIVVEAGNTVFRSEGNCIINTASKILIMGCKNSVVPTDGSVTSIGSDAFYNCTSLTAITIPGSVTSIGSSAFYGCSGLASITLPFVGASLNGTSYTHFGYIFGAGSYDYNTSYVPSSLQTVIITDGNSIGSYAFYKCTSLTSITIPGSVTSIGSSAFCGCSGLTSIALPFVGGSKSAITASSSTLMGYIFGTSSYTGSTSTRQYYTSSSSTTYYIPSSLRNITVTGGNLLYGAFYNCSGLTSITISDSVISIGSSAFSGCSGLTSIALPFVGGSKSAITASSSTLFGYIFGTSSYTGGTSTRQYYTSSSSTTYYIPSSLRNITVTGGNLLYGAFYNCSSLISVTISGSVTSIGSSAFYGCSDLESITLPFVGASPNETSYTHFGYIFGAGSYDYNSSYVPSSLQTVIITGGNSISSYAFYNCTSLTSITIPDSVTSIGSNAFSDCSGLASITLPFVGAFLNETSYSHFGYIFGAGNYYNLSYVPSSLQTVIITGGNSISSYAFYNCTSLISITIPDSVTSIGDYVFWGCSGLNSITIPDSVTSIGSYAFYNCTGLTSVTIGSGVTSIEEWVFSGCSGLTSITIPDSVTSIGNNAFSYCTGLISIMIGNGVTSIGYAAFEYCSGLTSITIPDSVTSIGSYAFYDCSSLSSVTFAVTTGWYVTQDSSASSGTSMTVTDPATNAAYLKSIYYYYYWKRNV